MNAEKPDCPNCRALIPIEKEVEEALYEEFLLKFKEEKEAA